jgi:hypothetical protein
MSLNFGFALSYLENLKKSPHTVGCNRGEEMGLSALHFRGIAHLRDPGVRHHLSLSFGVLMQQLINNVAEDLYLLPETIVVTEYFFPASLLRIRNIGSHCKLR